MYSIMDYDRFLNNKIKSTKPSGIRRFFDIANEMDNVISLSIGEPDFQTPWHIRETGIKSLERAKHGTLRTEDFLSLELRFATTLSDVLA